MVVATLLLHSTWHVVKTDSAHACMTMHGAHAAHADPWSKHSAQAWLLTRHSHRRRFACNLRMRGQLKLQQLHCMYTASGCDSTKHHTVATCSCNHSSVKPYTQGWLHNSWRLLQGSIDLARVAAAAHAWLPVSICSHGCTQLQPAGAAVCACISPLLLLLQAVELHAPPRPAHPAGCTLGCSHMVPVAACCTGASRAHRAHGALA
jgi:hypothetical protein